MEKLDGIHHISAITADATRNLLFYEGVMGLRLVKKTVNQDNPSVYHLFYADEDGSPGADLTFFEYPGAAPGRAGDGMVHRVVWRVAAPEALDFWADRLAGAGIESEREGDSLLFADPEGLQHELLVADVSDEPLIAEHPEVPAEHALQGFHAVRAYARSPEQSRQFLEGPMGFEPDGEAAWEVRGETRGGLYSYDDPPAENGRPGGGTIHHVAFATKQAEHDAWQQRIAESGAHPTPVIDRFYFKSIYFREPSGVLFELATMGPGFATDEDPEHLGERLSLPPNFEHLRAEVEPLLTPLPDPRATHLLGSRSSRLPPGSVR